MAFFFRQKNNITYVMCMSKLSGSDLHNMDFLHFSKLMILPGEFQRFWLDDRKSNIPIEDASAQSLDSKRFTSPEVYKHPAVYQAPNRTWTWQRKAHVP